LVGIISNEIRTTSLDTRESPSCTLTQHITPLCSWLSSVQWFLEWPVWKTSSQGPL